MEHFFLEISLAEYEKCDGRANSGLPDLLFLKTKTVALRVRVDYN